MGEAFITRRGGGSGEGLPPVGVTLEECSWDTIDKISRSGFASIYWKLGDTKSVHLSGSVGGVSLDITLYVYILGFSHNGAKHTIDFGTFKTAEGIDVCLCSPNNYWGYIADNSGGWKSLGLRYSLLGSTDIAPENGVGYDASSTCATNPVPNTLMAALPADLRAVMKPMTIYTDNVGYNNGVIDDPNSITASVDYLPLLAPYEMMIAHNYKGWITNNVNNEIISSDDGHPQVNTCEKFAQLQYAYYSAGNNIGKRFLNLDENLSISDIAITALRSPQPDLGNTWAALVTVTQDNAMSSFTRSDFIFNTGYAGIAPIFRV